MHRLAGSAAAVAVVVLAVFTLISRASADVPGAGCTADPNTGQEICQVGAGSSPSPSPSPSSSAAATGSSQPVSTSTTCSWLGVDYPCVTIYGTFDSSDGCYWRLWNPQPSAGDPAWQGHQPGDGAVYASNCVPTYLAGVNTWLGAPPGAAAVTTAQLAEEALRSVVVPKPTVGRSPAGFLPNGDPYTVVRIPTWFWTDAATYQPVSARADAGAAWAQVTVTPVALTFAPGDGGPTVSCPGPGRAWVAGRDAQVASAPGGCDYTYLRSSYGLPHDELTATYGIRWSVTWTGSGGTAGNLPDVTTTANSVFAVAEAQSVVTQ